jgi:hypothetical protein
MLFKMWRWIWTVEQADSYHQRSGQIVLKPTETTCQAMAICYQGSGQIVLQSDGLEEV